MSRKVYVEVTTRIIMQVPEGQDIGEIIQEMDYNFTSPEDMPDVDFLDTEIRDYEIKDVK